MTAVAPPIANDVSYATRIKHASHFAWQGQYLVMLEGDTCGSTQCKRRFKCDEDQARESFRVAGAVLDEAQASLLEAGALLGEAQASLFVAGVLGEVLVSLFAAGAVLGEAQVPLFVAGAILGEVQMSLSWQAQYLVKFGKMAGARNVVFFNTICLS